jgi:hypothetical protein
VDAAQLHRGSGQSGSGRGYAGAVPSLASLYGPVLPCSGPRGTAQPGRHCDYAALGQLIGDVTGSDYAASAVRQFHCPVPAELASAVRWQVTMMSPLMPALFPSGAAGSARRGRCRARIACGARLLDRSGSAGVSWRFCRLASSVRDLLGRLPAHALPARLPDATDPAGDIERRRATGTTARERGAAPPGRPDLI